MPQNKEDLHDLLSYQNAHAPWFILHEHQPEHLKRNLKFLRKLNSKSTLTLEELERLSEQAIKDALSAYAPHKSQSPPTNRLPTTPAQFFHSRMSQSPYFFDIISYSAAHSTPQSSAPTLSTSRQTSQTVTEQVHGFHLNEGEAFSSTRYYSEDRKSYAKIMAKNGEFTATSKNLTKTQEIDLALEMSYQFLLNLPGDKKEIHINGSLQNIHQLHAALLYLQKEAAPRFDDITFRFPEGVSITPDEGYLTQHLGTFSEPPHQLVQWQDFLKMELKPPSHGVDTDKPNSKKKHLALIDMERVFKAEDLSQQEKAQLNEYQRYIQEVWGDEIKERNMRKDDTEYFIATHEEFMQRTESAIRLLKKSPTLNKECETLIWLYTEETQSHQKTLEALYQNYLNYETQIKEAVSERHQAHKKALEECVRLISQHLKLAKTLTLNLSEPQQNTLKQHLNAMSEIKSLMLQETLTDEMQRSFGAQMLSALHTLESLNAYSEPLLFEHIKAFAQKQSVTQSRIIKNNSEGLLHASTQAKQRLNQFKSELQPSADSEVRLSAEFKEQLSALAEKIGRFIDGLEIEAKEAPLALTRLHSQLKDMTVKASASRIEWDGLKQHLDNVLPHLEDNRGLSKACTALKTQMSAPSLQVPPPNEVQEAQRLTR